MKAILMSIRPEWAAKILNGEKTIEIRKKFPSDYVGWVYIYCTKITRNKSAVPYIWEGKVVTRFWCDKVEEITTRQDRYKEFIYYETSLDMEDLLKQSCLDYNELDDYLLGGDGKAIHITKLEPFDKPKEIKNFKSCLLGHNNCVPHNCHECPATKSLTRAPQSWCYIEI